MAANIHRRRGRMESPPGQDKNSAESDYLAFISYRHADNTQKDQQWAT